MTDAATWTKALTAVSIVFVAYLVTMWIGMVFWTYRDITSRTADRVQRAVAVALVAAFNAPGFLLYLIMRPSETGADTLIRQLEADALIHDRERQPECPGCGHSMGAEFLVCPYCRTDVQTPCTACTRTLQMSWVLCPYCGADRPEEARAPALTPAPAEQRVPVPTRELQPAGAQRAFAPPVEA